MKKIYVVYDTKAKAITESFLDVNLACAVRTMRAEADTDAIARRLGRLIRWDDSIMYELSISEDLSKIEITNKFKLSDVVNLQHDKQAEERNKELEKKLAEESKSQKEQIDNQLKKVADLDAKRAEIEAQIKKVSENGSN